MPGTAWGSLTESNYFSGISWNGTDPFSESMRPFRVDMLQRGLEVLGKRRKCDIIYIYA